MSKAGTVLDVLCFDITRASSALKIVDNGFEVQVSSDALFIDGVPEHSAQLLDKLIANAIEFCEAGGLINVAVSQERGYALLTVSNKGPGLPEEMKDRIFDAMISLRDQNSRQGPHLGIGLHIARLITEFHKGQISAENLPSGDGVVISVRFPLARD